MELPNHPKFSVLMANYNNGKYIQEAIESVIHQTFSDWELLIMDDGSTDDSIAQISEFLKDIRISLIRNPVNRGKVPSLIDLVVHSKANIIGVLDSDDTLMGNALSVMYDQHIKNEGCGFIYSQFIFCDNNLNPICPGFSCAIPKGGTNLREIHSSAFRTYKKSLYNKTEGYDKEFIYAEDCDLVFKMEEVTDFFFVDKILYKHRILKKSISNNPNKKLMGRLFLSKAKYNAFCRRLGTKIPNLTKDEMSVELCIASVICLLLKRRQELIKYLRLSIDLNTTLIISMLYHLFSKIITGSYRIFFTRKTGVSLIYSLVKKEVTRQKTEAKFNQPFLY